MISLIFTIVGAILMLIGLILAILCLIDVIKSNVAPIITLVLGVASIIIGFITLPLTPERPHEYPAEEYNIDVKVTTFQGKVDSTYVIIPRKKYSNDNDN